MTKITMPVPRLRKIPGFKTLKAAKFGRLWRVVDCTEPDCVENPHRHVINEPFETYGLLCSFVAGWYEGQYE